MPTKNFLEFSHNEHWQNKHDIQRDWMFLVWFVNPKNNFLTYHVESGDIETLSPEQLSKDMTFMCKSIQLPTRTVATHSCYFLGKQTLLPIDEDVSHTFTCLLQEDNRQTVVTTLDEWTSLVNFSTSINKLGFKNNVRERWKDLIQTDIYVFPLHYNGTMMDHYYAFNNCFLNDNAGANFQFSSTASVTYNTTFSFDFMRILTFDDFEHEEIKELRQYPEPIHSTNTTKPVDFNDLYNTFAEKSGIDFTILGKRWNVVKQIFEKSNILSPTGAIPRDLADLAQLVIYRKLLKSKLGAPIQQIDADQIKNFATQKGVDKIQQTGRGAVSGRLGRT